MKVSIYFLKHLRKSIRSVDNLRTVIVLCILVKYILYISRYTKTEKKTLSYTDEVVLEYRDLAPTSLKPHCKQVAAYCNMTIRITMLS